MTTKTCTTCGETKTVDRFHRNRTKRDGLHSNCKTCTAAMSRAYNEAHREQRKAYREANREEIKAYREANRDKIAAYHRARYALIGDPGRDRARDVTARYATRTGEPWTPEEDRYILTGPGTTMDKALQLSRTYKAVENRAHRLRRQEQTV